MKTTPFQLNLPDSFDGLAVEVVNETGLGDIVITQLAPDRLHKLN